MLAIIQARVNSKRFPEKVLNKINDHTVLEQVINQVKLFFHVIKLSLLHQRAKKT